VLLDFFDGNSWTTFTTAVTDQSGAYSFTGVPALGAGQRYVVAYVNDAFTAGRLYLWLTRELTSYGANDTVDMGTFDIADVPLGNPPDDAAVNLPTTFTWSPRAASPSDSYALTLYDPQDFNPAAQTNPLGYTSSVTIGGLPPSFSFGVPYVWEMWIVGPNGEIGVSLDYHFITFWQ
jgi:hypothetical protein